MQEQKLFSLYLYLILIEINFKKCRTLFYPVDPNVLYKLARGVPDGDLEYVTSTEIGE